MPKRLTASQRAARVLGRVTSPRKAAASRRNGRLGGRPKKTVDKPSAGK